MTSQEFERIKEKIERVKEEKAQAQGAMKQIRSGWQEEFGFDSLVDAQKKIKELEGETKSIQGELDKASKELLAVTDWESI